MRTLVLWYSTDGVAKKVNSFNHIDGVTNRVNQYVKC